MPGAVNGAEVHRWIQKNCPELKRRIILISGDTANSDTAGVPGAKRDAVHREAFSRATINSMVEKTFGKP